MLLPFFEWCEASAVGEFIRTSLWLFPAIECVHLLGLVLLGGAVLLVDLRLFGRGPARPARARRGRRPGIGCCWAGSR